MTKMEDLPLQRDSTVSFTVTARRELWPQRDALAVANLHAAVDLAYLTVGYGTYVIDVDSYTVDFIETLDIGQPEAMFGIKYTWNIYFPEGAQ